jgi:hypothetical protein
MADLVDWHERGKMKRMIAPMALGTRSQRIELNRSDPVGDALERYSP